ncbi:hypothetical protein AB4Z50_27385 [Paenibacillus sp. 2TAB26]|uniref:hypothetical protein n=1 Tax=Paenibacillus sp. 2TAB26 TaxID=3233005 RepID=UPI003F954260
MIRCRMLLSGWMKQTCLSVTDTRALICVESAVFVELTDICSAIWAKVLEFIVFLLE